MSRVGDRWLVVLVVALVALTLWYSRFNVMPAPGGYAWYHDHGVAFVYPEEMNLWEVAIHDDARVVHDGSIPISEDRGTVGWNSGNVDFVRDIRDDYWWESSLTWLSTGDPGMYELHLFYTALETNAVRNGRVLNLTKGEVGELSHRGHEGVYQFFNYTIHDTGSSEVSLIYGVVGGYYCGRSGRSFELYYLDIFDSDPVYDREYVYSQFKLVFESIQCH